MCTSPGQPTRCASGRHIKLLEEEIATKNDWLERAIRGHEELLAAHRRLTKELERSNHCAEALTRKLTNGARFTALQGELAEEQERARRMAEGYEAKIAELQEDIRGKV